MSELKYEIPWSLINMDLFGAILIGVYWDCEIQGFKYYIIEKAIVFLKKKIYLFIYINI